MCVSGAPLLRAARPEVSLSGRCCVPGRHLDAAAGAQRRETLRQSPAQSRQRPHAVEAGPLNHRGPAPSTTPSACSVTPCRGRWTTADLAKDALAVLHALGPRPRSRSEGGPSAGRSARAYTPVGRGGNSALFPEVPRVCVATCTAIRIVHSWGAHADQGGRSSISIWEGALCPCAPCGICCVASCAPWRGWTSAVHAVGLSLGGMVPQARVEWFGMVAWSPTTAREGCQARTGRFGVFDQGDGVARAQHFVCVLARPSSLAKPRARCRMHR